MLIEFDEGDYAGFGVHMRSLSLGEFLRVGSMMDSRDVSGLCDAMAQALEEWNAADEDGDIPASRDGLLSLDAGLVFELSRRWLDAIAGLPDSLRRNAEMSGQYAAAGQRMPDEHRTPELARAEMIVSLCRLFGCLPSQLMREDGEVLRLVAAYNIANPPPKQKD